MSQSKEEIEASYRTPDPWCYQVTPDDIERKERLIRAAEIHGPYLRLLDIGAGEGWITKDYPAHVKNGFEISDTAASRFPSNVGRANPPAGLYDLVTANGIMYGHYDWELFMRLIREHASKHVMVSSIKEWELPIVSTIGRQIYEAEFPYRDIGHQRIRIFEVTR